MTTPTPDQIEREAEPFVMSEEVVDVGDFVTTAIGWAQLVRDSAASHVGTLERLRDALASAPAEAPGSAPGAGVEERLRQVADHDWRISFLAHTSDTAREALAALTEARREAQEAWETAKERRDEAVRQANRADAAEGQLAELRAALEPFAHACEAFLGVVPFPDEDDFQPGSLHVPAVTLRDFKRAVRALSATPVEAERGPPRDKALTFSVGEVVHKTRGYPFSGPVRAAFRLRNGEERFVVDHDETGLLHIFNAEQLAQGSAPKAEPTS